MYLIPNWRGGVHRLLLLSSSQSITRHTPHPPAHVGGQGVGRLLHCKEERRSTLRTPLCVSSPPCDGAPLSSFSLVGCILHCKDEEYAVYITPLQGGKEEYTAYSSSPPHNGVCGLIVVWMRIKSRMPTTSRGGEEVLCVLLVAGVQQQGRAGLTPAQRRMLLDGAIVI